MEQAVTPVLEAGALTGVRVRFSLRARNAQVVGTANTADLKSAALTGLRVRLPLCAHSHAALVEWQSRQAQTLVPSRVCRFKSGGRHVSELRNWNF